MNHKKGPVRKKIIDYKAKKRSKKECNTDKSKEIENERKKIKVKQAWEQRKNIKPINGKSKEEGKYVRL